MTQNKLIFAGVITFAVLILVTLAIIEFLGPSRTFEFSIEGTAGVEIVGEAEVDGKLLPIAATLPAKLTYEGKRVKVMITDRAGKFDQFGMVVRVDGGLKLSGKLGGSQGIIADAYEPRLLPGMRRHGYIGGLDQETARGLRK